MSQIHRRHCWSLLFLTGIVVSQTVVVADDVNRAVLSPVAQRVQAWFPADTETLVGASAFPIPTSARGDAGKVDFAAFAQILACGELAALEKGKYLKPLAGKKVSVALRGGRNFETVSVFGSHRSEGCSVIVFEEELGETGKEWTDLLRQGAKEVRTVLGREVFVFPSTVVMESVYQLKPWQGSFVVLLAPETVLYASSDAYLDEVLKRVDTAAADRAIPDDLPVWKQIDPAALAWMVRHIPKANEKRIIDAVTWSIKKDRVDIEFLPIANTADEVEKQARIRWDPPDGHLKSEFGRSKNGTVTVSFNTDLMLPIAFRATLNLNTLQNESGAVGMQ